MNCSYSVILWKKRLESTVTKVALLCKIRLTENTVKFYFSFKHFSRNYSPNISVDTNNICYGVMTSG